MGNCWPKRKVSYFQKRDRIKMWVESVSHPGMEVIRSTPEQWGTKLVRTHAVSDISVLSPALAMSKTSLLSISSSCIFFDALEYADSGDDGDAIFQEAVTSQTPCWHTRTLGGGGSCL